MTAKRKQNKRPRRSATAAPAAKTKANPPKATRAAKAKATARASESKAARRPKGAALRHETLRHPRPKSISPRLRTDDESESTDLTELGIGSPIVPPESLPSEPSEPPPPVDTDTTPAEVSAQIRALEARLDHLIRRATLPTEDEEPPPSISDQVTAKARDVVERIASVVPPAPGTAPELTSLFENPHYIRTWGPRSLHESSHEVDDFGFDPEFYARVRPWLEVLYRRYFRVEVRGIEHVPSRGRAVIVSNHAGTVPLDGAMLRVALSLDHPSNLELRWLVEDFVYYLPFAGVWFNRVGAVRACPENAERLLESDRVVAVFPEGARGIKKLFRDRYQLERFGRGGYVRLCLRTRSPIVPCAIIGAEETYPMLHRIEAAARAVGLPYLPVTPTFPWLGPLGLLPAPSKWTIQFGEPIAVDEYGIEAAEDRALVGRLSERVQASIDEMLRDGLGKRKSVWFG